MQRSFRERQWTQKLLHPHAFRKKTPDTIGKFSEIDPPFKFFIEKELIDNWSLFFRKGSSKAAPRRNIPASTETSNNLCNGHNGHNGRQDSDEDMEVNWNHCRSIGVF